MPLRLTSDDAALELPSLSVSLPPAEIYEGVELLPVTVEEARAAGSTPSGAPARG